MPGSGTLDLAPYGSDPNGGTITSLSQATNPVGVTLATPTLFMTFAPAPGVGDISFFMQTVFAGVGGLANCGAVPAAGQTCTPLGSAVTFVNVTGGNSYATISMQGFARHASDAPGFGAATPLQYIFTFQFNKTFQSVQADLAAGSITSTYSAAVTANPVSVPDMTITKTHVGDFTQGQTGTTYTITVTNSGNAPTSGTVSVTDTVPAGLTATAISGTNWNCTQPSGPCTRSDALGAGSSYEAITLTVNVACNAPANVTNTAQVSGGGESNTGNDTANDATTVNPGSPPSITCPGSITKFTDPGQFSATVNPGTPVTNGGCGPVSVTGVRSDGKPLNAPYPIGVTIITWTATDASNTSSSCAQSIAVMVPSGQRRKP